MERETGFDDEPFDSAPFDPAAPLEEQPADANH